MGAGSGKRVQREADGALSVRFICFDTVVDLRVYPDAAPGCAKGALDGAARALDACVERCRHFERLLSRTDPASDISRAHAAAPEPVPVARETAELVRAARTYCAGSRGCFDITMGTVTSLWDFHAGAVPARPGLAEALLHVGMNLIEVSPGDGGAPGGAPWLAIRDPQTVLDLGGIAKGYIADDLAELLCGRGVGRFALNLGGNVLVRGRAPGGDGCSGPWRIGVADPFRPGRSRAVIELDQGSVVTSGTHERRFSRGGTVYHHILDPRTGMPAATDAASATVVARRSLDCDGWSTTVLMLGARDGIAFAEGVPGIEALTVDECGRVRWTSGLAGRVTLA
ncbi:FAD:protein FMN transferase [Enorma burkinafasonensis]|uniref:FAD:protein FMN transferase n=1 Tax=Enorma burkinafasonensis TaxID=2590867 RepID=UPI001FE86EF2|nr:FAD:protein FMN transferase [Enorma burkinafasonensis]